jgi:hypothetical protein
MGHGRWSSRDWDTYTVKNTQGKTTRQIFNQSSLKADMDPRKITMRESRDSKDNPNSTPIILALDVTGSMGMIADKLAREGLGSLIEHILARKPVSDPHIMVMGVGDAACGDRAPLQVSQFEADIRIAEQLKNLYLEGGGGGNRHESYTLPWYFAAKKTDIDCVKRGKKGVIFTFGDEECPPDLTRAQIKQYIGDDIPTDISTADLLKEVSKSYDVFHVVIEQGNYASHHKQSVYDSWSKVLPKDRVISVKDYTKLPEILVSVLEVHGGKAHADVINSWQDKKIGTIVAEAIKDMPQKAIRLIPPIKLKPKPAAQTKTAP